MTVSTLVPHKVHKVWGRRDLPSGFGGDARHEEPVGEIWFQEPDGAASELLVKFLFTSERLSIQTHPDDARARQMGHERGKDEAWLILSAEPGARIALGTLRPMEERELRRAALDGSIVKMVDWRSVKAGDFIYSPAGTIHAIGGGLGLIEVQQNCDLTYRLYDYGRDRELHLEDGVAAARGEKFEDLFEPETISPGRTILARGGKFVVERWQGIGAAELLPPPDRPLCITPLTDGGVLEAEPATFGSVWHVDGSAKADLPAQTAWLVAYPGDEVVERLLA
jgi:mannose-6-phosphate isomerase